VEDSGKMRNLIEAVAEFNSDVDGVGGDEKVYRFEGEAAVSKLFNGLACIERSGVLNGQAGSLPTPFEHLVMPFAGEILIRAA